MKFHRPTLRSSIASIGVLVALAFAGAYGILVLTTSNQPGPAALPSAPVGSAVGFSAADPTGKWVVDRRASNFVGYRAKELLAVDFVASPNDAVGRTTDVDGSIDIARTRLTAGEISANVEALKSDQELRDQHLVEGLSLEPIPPRPSGQEGRSNLAL